MENAKGFFDGVYCNIGNNEMKKEKAPFKILFSNDTTNIETCVSPYHKKGEPFRPEMLEATVDETADTGIDVHMLQPGMGWVPWWKSKSYPADKHYDWVQKKYQVELDGFGKYMLAGGDILDIFIRQCRNRGIVPFVSFRLNDAHGKEFVDADGNKIPSWACHCISRFYAEHPEYRIGSDMDDYFQRGQNWAIPEVRENMFDFIEEICENYDIDGFELDFMRFHSYFILESTTLQQRTCVMTEFVKRVRKLLDRTSKNGQHRWLCVRIANDLAYHDMMGIDLPAMVAAGVEMVNVSPSYTMAQQSDFAKICQMASADASVYMEMTHLTEFGPYLEPDNEYDNMTYRRTTDEQYYTTAHLAYSRGADGISAFNFVYYREHGTDGRGPFNEPPFHIFNHMADPSWLASRHQQYYFDGRGSLPAQIASGETFKYRFDTAPPLGCWKGKAKLRIKARENLGESKWQATINGVRLEETSDRYEPYDTPYHQLLGTYKQHRAWAVPVELLKDGYNDIEVFKIDGQSSEIVYIDMSFNE
ncbi:MAG: hypothetical protein ACYC54_14210 [Sedimentisphaerales bacterium]